MHRVIPHQGLKRSLNLLVVLSMVLAALGAAHFDAPTVEAALGDIVAVHQGGRARHSFVSEYPATGRLYTLWTDISNVAAFQLNLSASTAADGSGWNGPDVFGNDQVEKADFPQIKASPDGRLHAVWSDGSGDGRVVHAFFTPGPGKNVDDAGQWEVKVVSEKGKNAYFDLDDAGNAFFIWDEQQGDGTLGLVGRRWDAGSASLGSSALIRGRARLGSIAVTGRDTSTRLHTIFINVGDGNTPYYSELNASFDEQTTVKLGDARSDDPSPQIVEDGADNVHMVWVMVSRPQREVFYRSRAASGAFAARETVSHNYSPPGTSANPNHASPTIAIDGTGTPYVAWKGSETGVSQIYERRREAGGFPDYSRDDAVNRFCISCGNRGSERGGLAEWPKYGFSTSGAVHLTWSQWDRSNTERVQYSLRGTSDGTQAPRPPSSGPPAPPPPAAPTATPTPPRTPTATPPPADKTAPTISNVRVTDVTTTTAIVRWTTNEAASSRVFYRDKSNGAVLDPADATTPTVADTTRVTTHALTLTNLRPGTVYNFRVRSTDASGNMAITGIDTFTTLAPALPALEGVSPEFCFAETGFCVRGAFLTYWQQHGGLAINGFPLSEAFTQVLEDGRAYRVQYFERVRMEYHAENAGTENEVQLGQFGRRLHPADPPAPRIDGQAYFVETGHNLGEGFLAYWQANGGLPQFGFPISEVIVERLENGLEYRVQYFERARFEYHPQNGAPYDILLGQFGRRILGETTAQR